MSLLGTSEQLNLPHNHSLEDAAHSEAQVNSSRPPSECNEKSSLEPPFDPKALENEIKEDLRALIKQSSEEENSTVILPRDLRKFWASPYRIRFYTSQKWYRLSRGDEDCVLPRLQCLSILLMANFQEWDKFMDIFNGSRTDKQIPFRKKDLVHQDFLGKIFGQEFYQKQWMFCPLVIEERKEPYELKGTDLELRFPYIETGKFVGDGSAGTVSKQVIAPYHLRYSTPGRPAVNEEPKAVACKRVSNASITPVEFENLRSLRKNLSSHHRIMVNIATITKISPDFGKVHYILYDLAACDLRKFLTTSPTANRKERHDSARPQRNDSHNMWPGAFIRESQNLADALDFLHTRLHFDTSESLAHNDIKPENILVFYTDSADKNDKYPVGQWKIADFGLSKIKERRPKDEEQPTGLGASSNLLDVDRARQMSRDTDLTHRQRTTSVSRTIPKRHPGRYTAPEIDEKGKDQMDARSADVWGLGCVLTEVIAYAIDPGLVKELEYVCEQPHFRDRRFYDEETKKVKSQFLDWLSNLSGKSSKKEPTTSKWIADSVSLIKRILVEEPSDRPTAKTIRNELSGIYKSMSPHKGKWLHLLDTTNILTGSSPMPGSGSVSAKSESPTEMEEGFPDDATGQSVPYIQLPESTNEL